MRAREGGLSRPVAGARPALAARAERRKGWRQRGGGRRAARGRPRRVHPAARAAVLQHSPLHVHRILRVRATVRGVGRAVQRRLLRRVAAGAAADRAVRRVGARRAALRDEARQRAGGRVAADDARRRGAVRDGVRHLVWQAARKGLGHGARLRSDRRVCCVAKWLQQVARRTGWQLRQMRGGRTAGGRAHACVGRGRASLGRSGALCACAFGCACAEPGWAVM